MLLQVFRTPENREEEIPPLSPPQRPTPLYQTCSDLKCNEPAANNSAFGEVSTLQPSDGNALASGTVIGNGFCHRRAAGIQDKAGTLLSLGGNGPLSNDIVLLRRESAKPRSPSHSTPTVRWEFTSAQAADPGKLESPAVLLCVLDDEQCDLLLLDMG